jgi:hypothetical protein
VEEREGKINGGGRGGERGSGEDDGSEWVGWLGGLFKATGCNDADDAQLVSVGAILGRPNPARTSITPYTPPDAPDYNSAAKVY